MYVMYLYRYVGCFAVTGQFVNQAKFEQLFSLSLCMSSYVRCQCFGG